jgi:unsaturated rhamnogalacturonyl hydrolase
MRNRLRFFSNALPVLGLMVAAAAGCSDDSTATGSGAGGSQSGTGGAGPSGGSGGAETGGTSGTGGTATGGASDSGSTGTGAGNVGSDAGEPDAVVEIPDGGSVGKLNCGAAPATDWGAAMVASTMKAFPDPLKWEYSQALFLHGSYLVYKRTKDSKILDYINAWADARIGTSTSNAYTNVDSMMPNMVLLDLFEETKDMKYVQGAKKVHDIFKNSYPRTSDGGFWHSAGAIDQTWGDTVFMGQPLLERYGHLIDDAAYTDDETTKQLLVTHDHLKNPNGLHWHAWAECRDGNNCPSWTTPTLHHSAESWGRANGWYMVATMIVLDLLPATHANRAPLIEIVKGLAESLKKWQDSTSGRWFQLVDKGTDPDNWLETSSSSMYTYMLAKSVRLGYIDASYAPIAAKGFQGVLQKIAIDDNGTTSLTDICQGTNVGNAAFYYARPRPVNDMHGLGSFLIMYEELRADCGF